MTWSDAWKLDTFSIFPLLVKKHQTDLKIRSIQFTAPFNNMRTLKFEAQPTNGFFAAVNQVFGGSS